MNLARSENLPIAGAQREGLGSSDIVFLQVYVLSPVMVLNDTVEIRRGVATTEQ